MSTLYAYENYLRDHYVLGQSVHYAAASNSPKPKSYDREGNEYVWSDEAGDYVRQVGGPGGGRTIRLSEVEQSTIEEPQSVHKDTASKQGDSKKEKTPQSNVDYSGFADAYKRYRAEDKKIASLKRKSSKIQKAVSAPSSKATPEEIKLARESLAKIRGDISASEEVKASLSSGLNSFTKKYNVVFIDGGDSFVVNPSSELLQGLRQRKNLQDRIKEARKKAEGAKKAGFKTNASEIASIADKLEGELNRVNDTLSQMFPNETVVSTVDEKPKRQATRKKQKPKKDSILLKPSGEEVSWNVATSYPGTYSSYRQGSPRRHVSFPEIFQAIATNDLGFFDGAPSVDDDSEKITYRDRLSGETKQVTPLELYEFLRNGLTEHALAAEYEFTPGYTSGFDEFFNPDLKALPSEYRYAVDYNSANAKATREASDAVHILELFQTELESLDLPEDIGDALAVYAHKVAETLPDAYDGSKEKRLFSTRVKSLVGACNLAYLASETENKDVSSKALQLAQSFLAASVSDNPRRRLTYAHRQAEKLGFKVPASIDTYLMLSGQAEYVDQSHRAEASEAPKGIATREPEAIATSAKESVDKPEVSDPTFEPVGLGLPGKNDGSLKPGVAASNNFSVTDDEHRGEGYEEAIDFRPDYEKLLKSINVGLQAPGSNKRILRVLKEDVEKALKRDLSFQKSSDDAFYRWAKNDLIALQAYYNAAVSYQGKEALETDNNSPQTKRASSFSDKHNRALETLREIVRAGGLEGYSKEFGENITIDDIKKFLQQALKELTPKAFSAFASNLGVNFKSRASKDRVEELLNRFRNSRATSSPESKPEIAPKGQDESPQEPERSTAKKSFGKPTEDNANDVASDNSAFNDAPATPKSAKKKKGGKTEDAFPELPPLNGDLQDIAIADKVRRRIHNWAVYSNYFDNKYIPGGYRIEGGRRLYDDEVYRRFFDKNTDARFWINNEKNILKILEKELDSGLAKLVDEGWKPTPEQAELTDRRYIEGEKYRETSIDDPNKYRNRSTTQFNTAQNVRAHANKAKFVKNSGEAFRVAKKLSSLAYYAATQGDEESVKICKDVVDNLAAKFGEDGVWDFSERQRVVNNHYNRAVKNASKKRAKSLQSTTPEQQTEPVAETVQEQPAKPRPERWTPLKSKMNDDDRRVIENTRKRLNYGLSELAWRLGNAKEKGDAQRVKQLVATAANHYLEQARRAYRSHGGTEALAAFDEALSGDGLTVGQLRDRVVDKFRKIAQMEANDLFKFAGERLDEFESFAEADSEPITNKEIYLNSIRDKNGKWEDLDDKDSEVAVEDGKPTTLFPDEYFGRRKGSERGLADAVRRALKSMTRKGEYRDSFENGAEYADPKYNIDTPTRMGRFLSHGYKDSLDGMPVSRDDYSEQRYRELLEKFPTDRESRKLNDFFKSNNREVNKLIKENEDEYKQSKNKSEVVQRVVDGIRDLLSGGRQNGSAEAPPSESLRDGTTGEVLETGGTDRPSDGGDGRDNASVIENALSHRNTGNAPQREEVVNGNTIPNWIANSVRNSRGFVQLSRGLTPEELAKGIAHNGKVLYEVTNGNIDALRKYIEELGFRTDPSWKTERKLLKELKKQFLAPFNRELQESAASSNAKSLHPSDIQKKIAEEAKKSDIPKNRVREELDAARQPETSLDSRKAVQSLRNLIQRVYDHDGLSERIKSRVANVFGDTLSAPGETGFESTGEHDKHLFELANKLDKAKKKLEKAQERFDEKPDSEKLERAVDKAEDAANEIEDRLVKAVDDFIQLHGGKSKSNRPATVTQKKNFALSTRDPQKEEKPDWLKELDAQEELRPVSSGRYNPYAKPYSWQEDSPNKTEDELRRLWRNAVDGGEDEDFNADPKSPNLKIGEYLADEPLSLDELERFEQVRRGRERRKSHGLSENFGARELTGLRELLALIKEENNPAPKRGRGRPSRQSSKPSEEIAQEVQKNEIPKEQVSKKIAEALGASSDASKRKKRSWRQNL